MEQDLLLTEMLHQAVSDWIELAKQISIQPMPDEYFVFKDPNAREWFILLIYVNPAVLNEAVKSGACYRLHELMWTNLPRVEEFNNIRTSIFFETANFPAEATEEDMKDFLDAAMQKANGFKAEVGAPAQEHCSACNHSFSAHRMAGYPEEGQETPTRGWMMCPEEGCNCFRTWSLE